VGLLAPVSMDNNPEMQKIINENSKTKKAGILSRI